MASDREDAEKARIAKAASETALEGKGGDTAHADRLARAGLRLSLRGLREGENIYLVTGETYPYRTQLRRAGGRWDAAAGAWELVGEDAAERITAELEAAGIGEDGTSVERTPRPHYWGHRQRLRERFVAAPESLPDYELLELLLFYSIERRDVKPLAKALIARFDSFSRVLAAPAERLLEVEGVTHKTLVSFKAMRETARRLALLDLTEKPRLGSARDVVDYCHVAMAHEPVEQLRLLFLDSKLKLIADEVQQTGTVNHTPAYPREIVKRALELGATGVILVHNHPSGDATPSRADVEMTEEIEGALHAVGLHLHDHFVIARNGHISLREAGYT